MNWPLVAVAVGVVFLAAVGAGTLVLWAALVLASRADDDMEQYWRDREEDPPLGI